MRKTLSGNITVQAAVVIPVVLLVFGLLMNMLFYYHDKNVICAVAHETAFYGSYLERPEQKVLEEYLETQLTGKLLLFSSVRSEIQIEEAEIYVCCTAQVNNMCLKEERSVPKTEPVSYIRNFRKAEKIGKEVRE